MAQVSLKNITKIFPGNVVAVQDVNLGVDNKEFVVLVGPSGCGKSTLLSVLGLLDSPTEGNYNLNDNSVAELSTSQRARIRNREVGFIFQSFNLIGDLTVYENVEYPLIMVQNVHRQSEPAGG